MVFIDPTEGDTDTRLPAIPGAVVCAGLEALTGADLLLSVLDAPASTETLIRAHVAAGALLVQRKSGADLVHSLGDRLNSSLARMHEVAPKRASQRVLLFTGVLTCGADGAAVIDGRDAMGKFWAAQAALARWGDRGGVVETLPLDSMIPQWVEMRLKHLREYAEPGGDIRFVYPPNDYPMDPPAAGDPLQLPIMVRDGRVVLAQLRGIGPKLAERIWDACGQNLGWALTLLTDESSPESCKISGIGVTTIRNIRQQFGLPPELRLHLLNDGGEVMSLGEANAIQTSY
jgi:hypothetical protein